MAKTVKNVAGSSTSHVLGAVAGDDTQFAAVKDLAEDRPGKVIAVLPLPKESKTSGKTSKS